MRPLNPLNLLEPNEPLEPGAGSMMGYNRGFALVAGPMQ